jgi:hypothetical protein
MSDQGYAASAVTADGARFDRRHRPAWTIYVAVLLWPLGLLALLRVKRVGLQVRSSRPRTAGRWWWSPERSRRRCASGCATSSGAPEDRDR